jgi:hypothetical protein
MICWKAVRRAVGREYLINGTYVQEELGKCQITREGDTSKGGEEGFVDLALDEKEEQEEEAETEKGGAGGHMQVPSFRCYRLDKAEIVTYRESRVTFRGIMIHCEPNAIYTRDTCGFEIRKDEKTMNV